MRVYIGGRPVNWRSSLAFRWACFRATWVTYERKRQAAYAFAGFIIGSAGAGALIAGCARLGFGP